MEDKEQVQGKIKNLFLYLFILLELQKIVSKLNKNVKGITKESSIPKKEKMNPMEKPMSIQEKNNLGENIRKLNPDQLRGIIAILSDPNNVETNLKYFEFDIEALPIQKLRELEKYVKLCLHDSKSKKGNTEANEKTKVS